MNHQGDPRFDRGMKEISFSRHRSQSPKYLAGQGVVERSTFFDDSIRVLFYLLILGMYNASYQ